MGSTSITLDDIDKERLGHYRHPDDDSWGDTLNNLMDVIVSYDTLAEGCSNPECDGYVDTNRPYGETSGLMYHYVHENPSGSKASGVNYYCSPDCMTEMQEEISRQFPRDPDLVRIGGRSEFVSEFSDAEFFIDGSAQGLVLPTPGAFAGTSSHGGEYDYIDEPVYLKKDGKWTYDGVIEDITHEESRTYIDLSHGWGDSDPRLYHPDERVRRDAREDYTRSAEADCPGCDATLTYDAESPPSACPECEHDLDIEPVDVEPPEPNF